jgi:hypothetical protein
MAGGFDFSVCEIVRVILQRKLHDTEFAFPSRVSRTYAAEAATDRYQLVVDGEYYSVRWAQQVTKEVSYANLNEMPAVDIARYLGKRVVHRPIRECNTQFRKMPERLPV